MYHCCSGLMNCERPKGIGEHPKPVRLYLRPSINSKDLPSPRHFIITLTQMTIHSKLLFKFSLSILLLVTGTISWSENGVNWPQFRGGNANPAIADNPKLPEKWSTTENVQWVTDVPGWGWSSPVVWDDKVFLTTVDAAGNWEKPKEGLYNGRGREIPVDEVHAWIVYCFDLKTGDVLWRNKVKEGKPEVPRHPKNTYASETPATDGERVYFLFGDVGLYTFDLEGNHLWTYEIEAKETRNDWGTASSPIVYQGHVYVLYDNQEESWLAKFHGKTGKEVWKVYRDEISSWATPFIWENEIRTELVTNAKNRIRSYDLDGNLLWEMDGRMSWACIATPISECGLLYVNSGYFSDSHRPVYAIKPGARGDITLAENEESNDYVAWYHPLAGNYNTSPLIYKGIYYSILDRGSFEAYNPATGEQIYSQRKINDKERASFTCSPWAYNDKVFCLSEQGETYVIEAGTEFNLLYQNSLEEMVMSVPAILDDKILIRTVSKLYCIGE
ncbi:MAG: serine/threonine protein kinase [Opitutaceae bacterium]|nr:serine/threonine protein kinase [Opitutaceae bacterium]